MQFKSLSALVLLAASSASNVLAAVPDVYNVNVLNL